MPLRSPNLINYSWAEWARFMIQGSPTLIYHPYFGHTYPFLVFDAEVSSSLNKAFHCIATTFFSCDMHRSLLTVKKKIWGETVVVRHWLSFMGYIKGNVTHSHAMNRKGTSWETSVLLAYSNNINNSISCNYPTHLPTNTSPNLARHKEGN